MFHTFSFPLDKLTLCRKCNIMEDDNNAGLTAFQSESRMENDLDHPGSMKDFISLQIAVQFV